MKIYIMRDFTLIADLVRKGENMARLEKCTFQYQRTFNLGDYNSLRLSTMHTVHFEPGDDVDAVAREVWRAARENVAHAARPIVQGYKTGDVHGITEEEFFLGLRVEQSTIYGGDSFPAEEEK